MKMIVKSARTWLGEREKAIIGTLNPSSNIFFCCKVKMTMKSLSICSSNILFLNSSMPVVPQLDKLYVQNQSRVSARAQQL